MRRLIFIFSFVMLFCSCNYRADYKTLTGFALGTTYTIVYQQPTSQIEILDLVRQTFADIDASLSVYNRESVISKVNRNEPVELDTLFINVFNRGREVYLLTDGAFDMAAAPYFDLWGFGFKNRELITQAKLDSISEFAGMDKIRLTDGKIEKADPRVSLNGNAIAKGYCSDVVAFRLRAAGVQNFLVEVGGEVHCEGVSGKRQSWFKRRPWLIGIDRPVDGNLIPGMQMQAELFISNRSVATSGNYRNYYIEEGQKYGHTVDPATGRPVQHSLLSATVIASDCMSADAFATAFMVMGLEKTKIFLERYPQIDAFLIYSDATGAYQSFATSNVIFNKNR